MTLSWTNIQVRLGDLRAWSDNPRLSTKKQAERLLKSFDEFGQVQTIAVSPDLDVYDGHQRLSALLTIHGKDYIVDARQSSRALTDEERRKLVIYLHSGAVGSWDWDALSGWNAQEVIGWGMDDAVLKEWKRDVTALGALIEAEKPPVEDAEPQIDRAEELREKWGVESGQLWQLGEHRLICGDCTDRAVVERVMGGEKAQMLFTSPPYAAQRDYEIGEFDWDALMNGMSDCAIEIVKDDGAIIVNLGLVHKDKRVIRYWDAWLNKMDATAFPLFDWYVWDKINGLMGDWRGRLAPAHEWIFHFANKPREANKTERTKYAENGITHYKKNKVGLRTKDGTMKGFTQAGQEVSQTKVADSVIRCQPARGGVEGHPAPFSVDFASALIAPFTNQGEIVFEPFSGSGTTIVACEGMRRICRAVELEPKYCAVAIQRWVDMTGKTPELVTQVETG